MVQESQNSVALVDRKGNRTGHAGKIQAHEQGLLHEAFSVLVFNNQGEVLLQQRAGDKYHSGGKWSNTCCSHPDPFSGRSLVEAAEQRLNFEMGFRCDLEWIDAVYYREVLDGGLVEHEYDHILVGSYLRDPEPNGAEVQAWQWMRPEALAEGMRNTPESYSAWLRHLLRSEQLVERLYQPV